VIRPGLPTSGSLPGLTVGICNVANGATVDLSNQPEHVTRIRENGKRSRSRSQPRRAVSRSPACKLAEPADAARRKTSGGVPEPHDVQRLDRPGQPLDGQESGLLDLQELFHLREEPGRDQDLAGLGLPAPDYPPATLTRRDNIGKRYGLRAHMDLLP
jgi:hypothetical protein